jgi:hypothetical protein
MKMKILTITFAAALACPELQPTGRVPRAAAVLLPEILLRVQRRLLRRRLMEAR